MKIITDLKVDNADDIILSDDDLDSDLNYGNCLLRAAERRVSARWDDFLFAPGAAGIERYIQQHITPVTMNGIEESIRSALQESGLLDSRDFDVHVIDPGNKKLNIIIKLKFPGVDLLDPSLTTFRVIINIENQGSYK